MLPIILDGSKVRVGLTGSGEALERRLAVAKAGGVDDPILYEGQLPDASDLASLQILFVAGLDDDTSRVLAEAARQAGVIVNVEDVPDLCDFHMPAQVRRGDLLLAISTAGKSPALSRVLRENLEKKFPPEWEQRLDELASLRSQWRADGASPGDVSARTRALLTERDWLE